ncbi:MAG TPA: Crp/Fnr family transcriptional regulator [Terracidiphilus sp.]|nr:Crp/Fnr family transcriptional regulator [Terracidiphilus sp.]
MSCGCKLSVRNQVLGLPDGLRPRFLSGLTSAELASVLTRARHRRFHAASAIISQDDTADRLFLLTSGHGRHFVITRDGHRILLQWLTAGQIFGGAAILSTPSQYLASTEVLSESCALEWERPTIRTLVSAHPALLDNAFSIAVTENIAWSTAAHVSLSIDDASGRVAHLLLSLASAIGESTPDGVVMRVGHVDLAEGAGVARETVTRCLQKWQGAGILAKLRSKIVLKKPELLLAARRD